MPPKRYPLDGKAKSSGTSKVSPRVDASKTISKFQPLDNTKISINVVADIWSDRVGQIQKAVANGEKVIISFSYCSLFPDENHDGLNMIIGVIDPKQIEPVVKYFMLRTEIMEMPFTVTTNAYTSDELFDIAVQLLWPIHHEKRRDDVLLFLYNKDLPILDVSVLNQIQRKYTNLVHLNSISEVVKSVKYTLKNEFCNSYYLTNDLIKEHFKYLNEGELKKYVSMTNGLSVPPLKYFETIGFCLENFDTLKSYVDSLNNSEYTEIFAEEGLQTELTYLQKTFFDKSTAFGKLYSAFVGGKPEIETESNDFGIPSLVDLIKLVEDFRVQLEVLAKESGPEFGCTFEECNETSDENPNKKMKRESFAVELLDKLKSDLLESAGYKQLVDICGKIDRNEELNERERLYQFVPIGGCERKRIFPYFDRLHNEHCCDRKSFPSARMHYLSVIYCFEEATHREQVKKAMAKKKQ